MPEVPPVSAFLSRQTYVAVDTETTGIWAPANRIVEIGAVRFTLDSRPPARFQQLINPLRPMPPEVIAIHGITDDMVKDAPGASDVLARFIEFCGPDSILVAHNAPFDISFLGCELDRARLSFPSNLILDTVDIYHRLFPGLASYSLLSLVQHFGIADNQEHRALADAEFVRALFAQACPRMNGIDSPESLATSFDTLTLQDWRAGVPELPEMYAPLGAAISRQQRVRLVYGFPPSERIIRPQAVYALNSKLYINAFCEKASGERTFRLDRIVAFELLPD